jgi:hypothetical protein
MKKQEYARQIRNETGLGAYNHRSISPLRVESKIKIDVVQDRYVHDSKLRNRKLLNEFGEWKYEEPVSTEQEAPTRDIPTPQKLNYAISYDKNLQPETIKEKPKNGKLEEIKQHSTPTNVNSSNN